MDKWQDVPHVTGRIATSEDVKAGRAVFVCGNRKKIEPVDIGIPRCAVRLKDGAPLIVVQSEFSDGMHMLGCRRPKGGRLICGLAEVELLEGPDERFYQ